MSPPTCRKEIQQQASKTDFTKNEPRSLLKGTHYTKYQNGKAYLLLVVRKDYCIIPKIIVTHQSGVLIDYKQSRLSL